MQPRRTPIQPATRSPERDDGNEQPKAAGTAGRQVVALFPSESGAGTSLRQPKRRNGPDEGQRRFDAFIDGLREVFARGGIAEVRELARAAASPHYATVRTHGPGERTTQSANAHARRRSEADMFDSILASLERARRRGGMADVLAEFSRIGRRIGRPASWGRSRR